MLQVFRWSEFVSETLKQFPEVNRNMLILAEDDLGLVVREVARAHELTLSEAAEMVVLRLPRYQPGDYQVRLSA